MAAVLNVDVLAQEVSRRLCAANEATLLDDPHSHVLRIAAEVETEWEGRARRSWVDESAGAIPAPSASAHDAIRAAVLALRQRPRELLSLHVEGLTYRQIAARSGLPEDIVMRELVEAYCRLRWTLESPLSSTGVHAMQVETFTPPNVMKPIGPYSHIAKAGSFIAISGTAGIDPATGEFAGSDAYSQARQILRSFRSMLEGVGSDLEHVLHVNVFLKTAVDFEEMNRAYREAFGNQLPARTVVAVSDLPKKGALMTMNLTAVTKD